MHIEFRESDRDLFHVAILEFVCKNWEKPRQASNITTGTTSEIRIPFSQNANQTLYRYAKLLGFSYFLVFEYLAVSVRCVIHLFQKSKCKSQGDLLLNACSH